MALSSTIVPMSGYAIVSENTTSGVTPTSNVAIGTVEAIEYGSAFANLNDIIFYYNKDIAVFSSSNVFYQVVPFDKILFKIPYTPVS